jgi:hypothetical protein
MIRLSTRLHLANAAPSGFLRATGRHGGRPAGFARAPVSQHGLHYDAEHPVHRRQCGAQREVRCGQVPGCDREVPADGSEPGADHDAAHAAQREAEDGRSFQRAQSLASGVAMPRPGQARLDRAHWRGEGERAVGGNRGHRRDRDKRPRVAAEAGQRRQGLCNGNPHPRRAAPAVAGRGGRRNLYALQGCTGAVQLLGCQAD